MFKSLRGMFSFIIYDYNKNRIFGARDFFGIKPLYYSIINRQLVFASEIKAILEYPFIRKKLNEVALENYLTFQYSVLQETFFSGIFKIPPGHCFTFKNGKLDIKPYWRPHFSYKKQWDRNYYLHAVNSVVNSAQMHQISDCEIGALLSGGIDSSLLAACNRSDKTFTVGFDVKKEMKLQAKQHKLQVQTMKQNKKNIKKRKKNSSSNTTSNASNNTTSTSSSATGTAVSLSKNNTDVKVVAVKKEDTKKHKKFKDIISSSMGNLKKELGKTDWKKTMRLLVGIDVNFDLFNKYSEIAKAKNLCVLLRKKNFSKLISADEFWSILPKVQYYMDEPLADPSAVPLYFACQIARTKVKACVSGEGADELFGGYNIYKEPIDMYFVNLIPLFIRRYIASLVKKIPFSFKGRNFIIRAGERLEERYIGNAKIFSKEERESILQNPRKIYKLGEITGKYYSEALAYDAITKMQYLDINLWLVGDILLKADKMSMANSLELRVPYLDRMVFEVSSALPTNLRVKKIGTKYALRKGMEKYLPFWITRRKKLGFPVPIRVWLREDKYYEMVKESFVSNVAKKYFHVEKILKLLDDHKNNFKIDNSRKIWTIYCFIIWYKEYFGDDFDDNISRTADILKRKPNPFAGLRTTKPIPNPISSRLANTTSKDQKNVFDNFDTGVKSNDPMIPKGFDWNKAPSKDEVDKILEDLKKNMPSKPNIKSQMQSQFEMPTLEESEKQLQDIQKLLDEMKKETNYFDDIISKGLTSENKETKMGKDITHHVESRNDVLDDGSETDDLSAEPSDDVLSKSISDKELYENMFNEKAPASIIDEDLRKQKEKESLNKEKNASADNDSNDNDKEKSKISEKKQNNDDNDDDTNENNKINNEISEKKENNTSDNDGSDNKNSKINEKEQKSNDKNNNKSYKESNTDSKKVEEKNNEEDSDGNNN
jgi:asparagine synthetase B (glutamine-hydrolysing)